MLTSLDQETLKEIGVQTIGQRLAILKAVYHLKLAHNVPIDPDHYVPPCTFYIFWGLFRLICAYFSAEAEDEQEGVTLESLHEVVKEQGS